MPVLKGAPSCLTHNTEAKVSLGQIVIQRLLQFCPLFQGASRLFQTDSLTLSLLTVSKIDEVSKITKYLGKIEKQTAPQ